MSPPILVASRLQYTYPGGVPALRDLDLTVVPGRKLALLGPNGSGKTTLLLHLNGTLQPEQGEVHLDGRPAGYDRRSRRAWRNRVGLVLQEPDDQLFSASVAQDVSFGPLNLGLPDTEVRTRVAEALAALGIGALAERATHALSFGQKKRVALAGVLAMRPQVLILDEPTAGLDHHAVGQLLAVLERLCAAGTTLVFATHDVDLVYAWADEVALFCDGRVLRQGETVTVLSDQAALEAARLRPPVLLELARMLRAELGEAGGAPPRSAADWPEFLRASIGGTWSGKIAS